MELNLGPINLCLAWNVWRGRRGSWCKLGRKGLLFGWFHWVYDGLWLIVMTSHVCEDDFYGNTYTNICRDKIVYYKSLWKIKLKHFKFAWVLCDTACLVICISHSSASTELQGIDVLVEIFSRNCLSYSNQLAFGFLLAPTLIV